MSYASGVLSSTGRALSPSNSNEPTSSGGKSSLLSSRSAKCLLLGGFAASYSYSVGGAMESSAGKAAEVARFSESPLSMSNVGLEPARGRSRFQDYSPLLRDAEAVTPISSCMQGVVAGGIGSLIVQNPLPLLVGLGGCFPKAGAQQRLGNEFQVNTYTSSGQEKPSAASLSNGNFVVAWHSELQDGSGYGVYGQVFDWSANRIGNEFQVNAYTTDNQVYPSVASFSNGNFVVAWQGEGQGDSVGIYGQLFDGSANRIGNEFQVNTYTSNDQRTSSAASFNNGNFIVTWHSNGQDGSSWGTHGQLFDGNANKIGNEFQVNTYTSGHQYAPSTVSFSNGNFVVTWDSDGQDGSSLGVYGQLFDGNANRIGNEFQVNTYTNGAQGESSAVSFSNGNFVVAWMSFGQDGSDFGIYGQLFDINANRIGNEFQVSTYANSYQGWPSAAGFSNDNFVVIWQSLGQDGSSFGVYGQLFDNNANGIGNEFQVNAYINDSQYGPSTATLSNGNFVVTWSSLLQDGSLGGIYGQLFDTPWNSSYTFSTTTTTEHLTTTSQPIITTLTEKTSTSGSSTNFWIGLVVGAGVVLYLVLAGGGIYHFRKKREDREGNLLETKADFG